jgi:hypothetical protein
MLSNLKYPLQLSDLSNFSVGLKIINVEIFSVLISLILVKIYPRCSSNEVLRTILSCCRCFCAGRIAAFGKVLKKEAGY